MVKELQELCKGRSENETGGDGFQLSCRQHRSCACHGLGKGGVCSGFAAPLPVLAGMSWQGHLGPGRLCFE